MSRTNISSLAYPIMAYLDRKGIDMAMHRDEGDQIHPAILRWNEKSDQQVGFFLFLEKEVNIGEPIDALAGLWEPMKPLPIASKDLTFTFKDRKQIWEHISKLWLRSLTDTLHFSRYLKKAIERLERYEYFEDSLSNLWFFPALVADQQLGITLNDPESEFIAGTEIEVSLIRPLAIQGKPWMSIDGKAIWRTKAEAQGVDALYLINKDVTEREYHAAIARLNVPNADTKPNTIWVASFLGFEEFLIRIDKHKEMNKVNTRVICVNPVYAITGAHPRSPTAWHGFIIKEGWHDITLCGMDNNLLHAVQILLTTKYGTRIWDRIVHLDWNKKLINPYDYHNKTEMIKTVS